MARHACRLAATSRVLQGAGGGGVSSSRKRQKSTRQLQVSLENDQRRRQSNQVKPTVPWHKTITKKAAKRMAVLTLIYVVFCAALFWRYYPDPSEANLKVVEGIPTIYKSGSGRNSTSTIEIEGIRFSCSLSPIGPSVSCPTQLHQPGTRAQGTFFFSRTIQDDLIGSRQTASPILMRLKQSDATVWAQNNEQVFSKYEFGSIFDFAVLALIPLILSSFFLPFQKK